MIEQLEAALAAAREGVTAAQSLDELKELRTQYLGKKGTVTQVLRGMGGLPAEQRPVVGQRVNEIREAIETLLEEKTRQMETAALTERLATERVDVTLPGTPARRGHKHPLQQVRDDIEDIFLGMGFEIAEGPEVETDLYNFELLNLPKDHPARDMQDSLFITEDILLRTHTSPVQIRYMLARVAAAESGGRPHLPVRIIAPGRVYRNDPPDATHSPLFHQVEGLVIDRGITMGDLNGTLLEFARRMYGPATKIRLRPSYFPFTEPSAEVDVSCVFCGGDGCRVCKQSGWLEILGAGMVHPNVLRNGGYDPEEVSGFAFGMGIDRIAMLRYGIDDLRHLFDNDLRFLRQF
ncbi:MAG: phenylalanine--tRNA ligase subunit alpha [Symbiobacteriia bacterium]